MKTSTHVHTYSQHAYSRITERAKRGDLLCKARACPGRSKLPSAKLSCSAQLFTLTTTSLESEYPKENHTHIINNFVFLFVWAIAPVMTTETNRTTTTATTITAAEKFNVRSSVDSTVRQNENRQSSKPAIARAARQQKIK